MKYGYARVSPGGKSESVDAHPVEIPRHTPPSQKPHRNKDQPTPHQNPPTHAPPQRAAAEDDRSPSSRYQMKAHLRSRGDIYAARTSHIPPGNLRIARLQLSRQVSRGFRDYLQAPRHRIKPEYVVAKRLIGQIGNEAFYQLDVMANRHCHGNQGWRPWRKRSRLAA